MVVSDAYAVSTLKDAVVGDRFQFERLGIFWFPTSGFFFILFEIIKPTLMQVLTINCDALLGYYAVDKDSEPGKLVFNRTVTLRDSYGKGWK